MLIAFELKVQIVFFNTTFNRSKDDKSRFQCAIRVFISWKIEYSTIKYMCIIYGCTVYNTPNGCTV